MKIAVVGCSHGKLDQIYEDVKNCQIKNGYLIDAIIICGDIQAARNRNDLKCMALPNKDKELGDFHEYYSGKKMASHLTLVIGGNTEASNYFQTLPYGGWLAYNIYYMGYSSIVKLNGVRIAGISGIFNKSSIKKGYYEHLPYDQDSIKSVYYTRYLEVFRMLKTKEKIDVIFTHDWPNNIYKESKAKDYLREKKKNLKKIIEQDQLGNPLYQMILDKLKPKNWFAAHYHIYIEINYLHQSSNNESNQQQDNATNFVALNKCEKERNYLKVVNIKSDEFNLSGLEYDLEWLAILKATNEFVSIQKNPIKNIPHPEKWNYDLDDFKIEIKKKFNDNFKINENNFNISPPIDLKGKDLDPPRKKNYTNPQTTKFCELLGLTDPISSIIDLINGKINNPTIINIETDEDENNEWNGDDEVDLKKEKNLNTNLNTKSNQLHSNLTNKQSIEVNFKPTTQPIQNNLKSNNSSINELFNNKKSNHKQNSNVNIKLEKYNRSSPCSETLESNGESNNCTIGSINQYNKVFSIKSYIKNENNRKLNEILNEPLNNENLDVPMDGDTLEDTTIAAENKREFTNNFKKEKDSDVPMCDILEDTTIAAENKRKFINNIKKEKNLDVPMCDILKETTVAENKRESINNIKKENNGYSNEFSNNEILTDSLNNENLDMPVTGDTIDESTTENNNYSDPILSTFRDRAEMEIEEYNELFESFKNKLDKVGPGENDNGALNNSEGLPHKSVKLNSESKTDSIILNGIESIPLYGQTSIIKIQNSSPSLLNLQLDEKKRKLSASSLTNSEIRKKQKLNDSNLESEDLRTQNTTNSNDQNCHLLGMNNSIENNQTKEEDEQNCDKELKSNDDDCDCDSPTVNIFQTDSNINSFLKQPATKSNDNLDSPNLNNFEQSIEIDSNINSSLNKQATKCTFLFFYKKSSGQFVNKINCNLNESSSDKISKSEIHKKQKFNNLDLESEDVITDNKTISEEGFESIDDDYENYLPLSTTSETPTQLPPHASEPELLLPSKEHIADLDFNFEYTKKEDTVNIGKFIDRFFVTFEEDEYELSGLTRKQIYDFAKACADSVGQKNLFSEYKNQKLMRFIDLYLKNINKKVLKRRLRVNKIKFNLKFNEKFKHLNPLNGNNQALNDLNTETKESELSRENQIENKLESSDKANKKNKKSNNKLLKIVSFNVNGVRAIGKRFNLVDYITKSDADIFCLQNIKCNEDQLPGKLREIDGYHLHLNTFKCEGKHSCVATYSRIEPLNVKFGIENKEEDFEARVITLDFDNFYLVNVYSINLSRGRKNLDKKREFNECFKNYLMKLDKIKPVVACGDFKCAHKEIDLSKTKDNTRYACFTTEEREDFTQLLDSGFIDSFRFLYPDKTKAYTFWSARKDSKIRDVGWRLDYFILSERLKHNLVDNIINKEVKATEHCPITCILNL